MVPSGECIEALITISNELGNHDRAAGVLSYLSEQYPDIPIAPQWLEKLCRWEDARQSYMQQNVKFAEIFPSDRPPKHEKWMTGELGNLHCLQALGEFEELEDSATALRR